jgi:hypothetical protein
MSVISQTYLSVSASNAVTTTISNRVTACESNITACQMNITALQLNVTNITGRLATDEASISTLNTSVASINTTLTGYYSPIYGEYVTYDTGSSRVLTSVYNYGVSTNYVAVSTYKIFGSNDNTTWNLLASATPLNPSDATLTIVGAAPYRYYAWLFTSLGANLTIPWSLALYSNGVNFGAGTAANTVHAPSANTVPPLGNGGSTTPSLQFNTGMGYTGWNGTRLPYTGSISISAYNPSNVLANISGLQTNVTVGNWNVTTALSALTANIVTANMSGLNVTGTANMSGLNVTGTANIVTANMSGLNVTGTAKIVTANISGLNVTGTANIVTANMSGLNVTGTANISGLKVNVANISGLNVTGALTVTGNAGIQTQTLSVTGTLNAYNNLNVVGSGSTTLGYTNVNSTLNANGDLTVGGVATFNGALNAQSMTVLGNPISGSGVFDLTTYGLGGPNTYINGAYSRVEIASNFGGNTTAAQVSTVQASRALINGQNLTGTSVNMAAMRADYNISGTNNSNLMKTAMLACIRPNTNTADAAVISYIDGDDGVAYAGAAYAVRMANSSAGSGFGYGLDLTMPNIVLGGNGAPNVPFGNADIRLNNGLTITSTTSALVNNSAAPPNTNGCLYLTTNAAGLGKLFISSGGMYRSLAFDV